MPLLGLFSRKLATPELTPDIEELLIQIGRLEERLAAKHRKKHLKTNEDDLKKELGHLRQKLLEAKAAIGPTKRAAGTSSEPSGKAEVQNPVKRTVVRDEKPQPAMTPRPVAFSNEPGTSGKNLVEKQSTPSGPRFHHSVESIASELHPKTNEDSWLVVTNVGAAAVFDGVSAANLAAEASLRASRHVERSLNAVTSWPAPEKLPELLGTILESANDLLWRINQANKTNELATTATIALVTTYRGEPAVAFASVGDSRLSIWHTATERYEVAALDDQLLRLLLTPPPHRPAWLASILETHQLAPTFQVSPVEMVKLAKALDGLANPKAASPVAGALFAERNLVTQSLGLPQIIPHIGLLKASHGDRLLLATDGLHDNLREGDIIEILRQTPLEEAAAALVVRAHEVAGSTAPRAKKDDITAIVLELI